MTWTLALLAVGFLGAAAHAERCIPIIYPPSEPGRDAVFAAMSLSTVTGTGKLHFSKCAGTDCGDKPYVMPGDIVLTTNASNGWVCALFPNRLGGTSGWLPADRLKPVPVATTPPLSAWTGRWEADSQTEIEITRKHGQLSVEGSAVWQGPVPTAVHTGELEGSGLPTNGILELPAAAERDKDFDPAYECVAKLRLVGPYLVVEDNLNCGGVNVTFTGAYRQPAK